MRLLIPSPSNSFFHLSTILLCYFLNEADPKEPKTCSFTNLGSKLLLVGFPSTQNTYTEYANMSCFL
uniref:Uncharacterized protein n=1 Tax=Populus trichocarpa TaxID=3694 RepID=A0A2K2AN35_POPTR